MKLLTLFRAFQCAEEGMAMCKYRRGGGGIRVAGDRYARQYQRYDRIAWKLERRIVTGLGGETPERGVGEFCIICGWRGESCECEEMGWKRSSAPKE